MKCNLKKIREKAGISQKLLGELIGGMTQANIAIIENSGGGTRLDTAYKLATIFNVRIEEIWTNDYKVTEEKAESSTIVKKEITVRRLK